MVVESWRPLLSHEQDRDYGSDEEDKPAGVVLYISGYWVHAEESCLMMTMKEFISRYLPEIWKQKHPNALRIECYQDKACRVLPFVN